MTIKLNPSNPANVPGGGHIYGALKALSSAMNASNFRFKVASENMANAETTASTPGGDPYARKVVTFTTKMDPATGAETIHIDRVLYDNSSFKEQYLPGHPAADETGMVKLPNINRATELVDAQESNIALRAASQLYRMASDMMRRTNGLIDTTKGA